MFDKRFLPSRGLRVVSAAALGIALASLAAVPFPRRTSTHRTCQMGLHSLTSWGTRSRQRQAFPRRLQDCKNRVEIGGPATYAMVLAAGREAVAARHPVDDRLRFLAPFDPVVWERRRFICSATHTGPGHCRPPGPAYGRCSCGDSRPCGSEWKAAPLELHGNIQFWVGCDPHGQLGLLWKPRTRAPGDDLKAGDHSSAGGSFYPTSH